MYQISLTLNNATRVLDRNLTLAEANTRLEEYHSMEKCFVNRIVSPIVALRSSGGQSSFVVDHNQDHYIFQIEEMFN